MMRWSPPRSKVPSLRTAAAWLLNDGVPAFDISTEPRHSSPVVWPGEVPAMSEQDCDNSGQLGPQAKGVTSSSKQQCDAMHH